MKSFNRIFVITLLIILLLFIGANSMLIFTDHSPIGRPYRVEINRLVHEIEGGGFAKIDLTQYKYVTNIEIANFEITNIENANSKNIQMIEKLAEDFFDIDNDYFIREVGGKLYRFDYSAEMRYDNSKIIAVVNIALGVMALVMISVMLFIRQKILMPFEELAELPYELSKGNLTSPIKESRNRFFGRFIWGVDLLRENMEQQKQRELALQKEKKTILLSLSHDIKTPLSAIKLYAKALLMGLYTDREKQFEIVESINAKADEIEGYVAQIVSASKDDFISLEVNLSEFYLSELIDGIKNYYSEKLKLIKTDFTIGTYTNCLVKGDINRSVEVLQNVIENAIKYGDGSLIEICFGEEDGCILVSVKNGGCTLSPTELPHIFESFWRGTNAAKAKGSGLGLYICQQLMRKMNGEIFADIKDGFMVVTIVYSKV